jgi:hypothetical protein
VGAALWSPGHSVRTIGAVLAEAAPRWTRPCEPEQRPWPAVGQEGGAQFVISPSKSGRYDSDDRSERHFETLGRQQCLDLMESHHLGRVGW